MPPLTTNDEMVGAVGVAMVVVVVVVPGVGVGVQAEMIAARPIAATAITWPGRMLFIVVPLD
jgi:hypothetical protein